jgi:hypothetical protein
MPSYGGAHGPDGSKKSGDQGQGSRDSDGGQTGGGNGGKVGGTGGFGNTATTGNRYPGYRGPTGTRNAASHPEKPTGMRDTLGGQNYRGGRTSPSVSRATQQLTNDYIDRTYQGATPEKYGQAMRDFGERMADYNGEEEDFIDWIGNQLADLFGFEESMPSFDINNTNTLADWGWDPVETALAVGGMFNPALKTASSIYGGYEFLGGPRPSINMGTSVIGQDQSYNSAPAASFGGTAIGNISGGFGGAVRGGPSAKQGGNGGSGEKTGGSGIFGGTPTPGRAPSFPTPAPAAPKPPATPALSTGPLPPGVSLVNYSTPIYNRDTGGVISVPGSGSGFTSGYGQVIQAPFGAVPRPPGSIHPPIKDDFGGVKNGNVLRPTGYGALAI